MKTAPPEMKSWLLGNIPQKIRWCLTFPAMPYIRRLNSNCSIGHMSTCKVIRGRHYDADATMAVPELTTNRFYIIFPVNDIMNYRQIISSRLYVRINQF